MKVIVIGPRGKMGKLITQVAASRDDMELVGAIAPKGRDYIGKDLGTVVITNAIIICLFQYIFIIFY